MLKFDTVLSRSFYCEDENLMVVRLKDDNEMNLENVVLNNEQTYRIMGDKVVKVIYDVRQLEFSHIPKEVLKYMADSPHSKYQESEAFILAGLGQKIIANFYLAVMKPKTKTKMFTNFDQALEWHQVKNKIPFQKLYSEL
ncbi:MAG: hypothetical protein K0S32_2396 [Bacteroidetes bacterium]|jgi:hypothetical protein|nr:hypothetical protein [Bacteroidota bacterium]